MQNEKLRQTKPDRSCFTCRSKDHFKRYYPIELSKKGGVAPISMADLIELDLSQVDEVEALEEMSQRFQAQIGPEEFSAAIAKQVMLVDLDFTSPDSFSRAFLSSEA